MLLRPACAALVLLLAACSADPTPPPDGSPADAAQEAGADAAEDRAEVGDDRPAEVGVDVQPDTPVAPDVPAPDAAPDAAPEAGPDAPPDVPAPDAAPDATPEAGPDAAPDAPVACPPGAVRCSASGGAAIDYCVGGAWVGGGACSTVLPPGTATECAADTCVVCRRGDAGAGCSPDPLCAADAECFVLGLGRCQAGRCARRGAIRCATNSDCGAWTAGGSFATCAENLALMGARTCGSTVERCSADAMCPAAFACDVSSGFCVAR